MNNNEAKKKLEVPSECSTEEFTRFEKLTKRLLNVPKREIPKKVKQKRPVSKDG